MDIKNNSGYRNSGYYNSGYYNSGDCNSGDYNSGYRNSGYRNSGYRNSGDYNSGHCNSGYYNSGDYNSGMFNTNEPKMRMFNIECDMTYTEFRKKFGYKDIVIPLTSWIDVRNMSKAEKMKVVGWSDMGGYLKKLSYKEAWAEAWKSASEEQRNWYKSLPNFSTKIFKEITGIDVEDSVN